MKPSVQQLYYRVKLLLFDGYNCCCDYPPMTLGSNVKRLREAAGLTQSQLADAAGMDQQALGALEKRNSKSSSFTAALAKALGTTTNELLGMPAEDKTLAMVESDDTEPRADELIELLTLYQQSSPEGRKIIMASARSSAKSGRSRWIRAAGNEA